MERPHQHLAGHAGALVVLSWRSGALRCCAADACSAAVGSGCVRQISHAMLMPCTRSQYNHAAELLLFSQRCKRPTQQQLLALHLSTASHIRP